MRQPLLSVALPIAGKAIAQPLRNSWAIQSTFLQTPRPTTTTFPTSSRPKTIPYSNIVLQKRTVTMSQSQVPDRYKLVFYVPHSHLEPCKEAVFAAGAGVFDGGKYSKACFQMPGTGQFLPGSGANPAIGAVGGIEYVEEMKVEVMCVGRSIMLDAVKDLVKAHPYEEVAYEVYKMENV